MHALGARGAGRERVEAPLVEGAYGIPHRLRSAPKVFGDLRRSVSAGARKQDLAPAHHEGIFGAQPGFEPFALLFRQIPDKNWRFHGGNYRPLHTTLSEDALVLWSAQGALDSWYVEQSGPIALWRAWGDDVRGHALSAGHFFPEEVPKQTADALNRFFGAPKSS